MYKKCDFDYFFFPKVKMHEFDAGGSAQMSSSKIWDKRRNEETKSHIEAC